MKHWFNNGIENKYCESCPDGFVPGKLRKKLTDTEKANLEQINAVLEHYSKEEINNFYFNHTRIESISYFNLKNEKQLVKLLTLTGYDFSQVKPTQKNCLLPENKRTHESYKLGDKKSAETQIKNWETKTADEKHTWSKKQKQAHSSKEYKQLMSKINKDRFKNKTQEEMIQYAEVRSQANLNKWCKNKSQLLQKSYNTKKANNSFNLSKPEDDFYTNLCEKYGESEIIRQYTDDRYPFNCDFYIKSTDTFIELNLSWTHGGHKFDETDQADLVKLHQWQEKAIQSDYYKNAIETWTIGDLKKFEYAEKHNLNYIVYYTIEELK